MSRRQASRGGIVLLLFLVGACGQLGGALGGAQQPDDIISGVTDNADPAELPPPFLEGSDVAAAAASGSDDSLMDYDNVSEGPLKPSGSVGGASVSPSFNFTKAALLRQSAAQAQEAAAQVPASVADAAASAEEDEPAFGLPQQAGGPPPQPAAALQIGGTQTIADKIKAAAAAAVKQLSSAAAKQAAPAGEAASLPQQSGGYKSGPRAAPDLAQPAAAVPPAAKPSAAQDAAVQPTASQPIAVQSSAQGPADKEHIDIEDLEERVAEVRSDATHEAWLAHQEVAANAVKARISSSLHRDPGAAATSGGPLEVPHATGSSSSSSSVTLGAERFTTLTHGATARFKTLSEGLRSEGQEGTEHMPKILTKDCYDRMMAIAMDGSGGMFAGNRTEDLLAEVAAIKRKEAEDRTTDTLASLLAGAPTNKYVSWHMEHMIKDFQGCIKSSLKLTGVPALRDCLQHNKRELKHADIIWFDEHFLATLRELLPDVRSMFGFGSGRGDFERDFFNAGTNYTFGVEPAFLGSLGFYAPGWDYHKGPVQLTEMLADASGIAELEDFRCFMFGDANARVDLVQSFEVMEEIPREYHCAIINELTAMAGRWVAVTMGAMGQGGGHHIANRHRLDMLEEWTKRGLIYRDDLVAAVGGKACYMCSLHYLMKNVLIFEVDPSRVVPVDCSKEGPADWAPYEDFESQMIYLPNGTAVPSTRHRKEDLYDWNYVLRLKAG